MSRDWSNLTWREKTWNERGQTVLCFIMATAIGLAIFIFGILSIGDGLDGLARYNAEHRRCLERATNGLEIEQCR